MLSLYSNPSIIKPQPPLVSLQQEDTAQCNENVTEVDTTTEAMDKLLEPGSTQTFPKALRLEFPKRTSSLTELLYFFLFPVLFPAPTRNRLVRSTTSTDAPIILRCNLPTLQSQDPQTGFGIDLYDLRALHAKSLVFVHAFIDKLKAAGYQASYKLTVSAATSCTLIRVAAGDPYASLPQNELDRVCCKLKEKLSLVE
ncbi:hypothetical protein FRB90_005166, partial [Tulasnella sp. 427]